MGLCRGSLPAAPPSEVVSSAAVVEGLAVALERVTRLADRLAALPVAQEMEIDSDGDEVPDLVPSFSDSDSDSDSETGAATAGNSLILRLPRMRY